MSSSSPACPVPPDRLLSLVSACSFFHSAASHGTVILRQREGLVLSVSAATYPLLQSAALALSNPSPIHSETAWIGVLSWSIELSEPPRLAAWLYTFLSPKLLTSFPLLVVCGGYVCVTKYIKTCSVHRIITCVYWLDTWYWTTNWERPGKEKAISLTQCSPEPFVLCRGLRP